MRVGVARPFFRESAGGGEVDQEVRRIFERGVDGLGPQELRVWLLVLDAKGYPRGDMIAALRTMSAREALDLENVAHLRRWQIDALTTLTRKRLASERAKEKARRG